MDQIQKLLLLHTQGKINIPGLTKYVHLIPDRYFWYNSLWKNKKKITITPNKISGTNTFTNYPLLINITDSDLTSARADGFDIVFVDSNGVKLDHEIQEFSNSTGKLVAWIRIPSLNKSDNKIFIFWNHTASSDQSNKNGVWDNDYAAVYHLNQTTFGADSTKDSTSNNNHGTPAGTMISEDAISGKVGGAVDLDGVDDEISIPDDNSLDITDVITLEAWVKTTDSTDFPMMLNKGAVNTAYLMFVPSGVTSPNKAAMRIVGSGDTAPFDSAYSTTTVNDGLWHHIVGTYDGVDVKIYVDGKLEDTFNVIGKVIDTTSIPLFLASSDNINFMTGSLDEIRISNIVRSADFIKTQYNNQNSPSTFMTFGSKESAP